MSLATGSLVAFMDELEEWENTVDPERIRVYRWRPPNIDVTKGAALYNNPAPTTFSWLDVSNVRARDTFSFTTRIAVRYSDDAWRRLEVFVDSFREKADAAFRQMHPLGSQAKWVDRVSFAPTVDAFNEVDYPAFEFTLVAWLDRIVTPT